MESNLIQTVYIGDVTSAIRDLRQLVERDPAIGGHEVAFRRGYVAACDGILIEVLRAKKFHVNPEQ